ncbi:filamentous hemagglutinin family N-terminal domain protein [Leptolyngbya sp. PCC 7375]|nr:filamentous hemagglutinin family N-terminal domain protein [Leptolyngbya sp. PCC 7375]
MENCLQRNGQMSWMLGVLLMTAAGWNTPVRAESVVIPDNTLGTESSVINNLDDLNQIVEGGAVRESNLFHSFLEFNVAEDHGIYFANPADIESILTRVTGDNPSNILGRLGVLGEANLFLLNPNGIVFGENASLDINGSFYASTAESISLGEGVFSATVPESSQLLTVNPEVTFFSYLMPGLGEINNSGELSVGTGKTLTLLGDMVLSSGALTASGGTVQVLGNLVGLVDQATVDVSGATGGGTVLVGGDYQGQGTVPAAERTFVGSEVVIAADALDVGDGGRVIVWADGATRFGGRISAQGGPQGGDGGFVEVSGLAMLDFAGEVNTQTLEGEAGQLLLDPANIVIADTPLAGFETVEQADGVLVDFLYSALEDAGQESHLTPETVESLLALNDLTLEATNAIIVVGGNVNGFSENNLTLRAARIGVISSRLGQSGGGDIVLETPQVEGSFVLVDEGLLDTNVSSGPRLNGGNITILTHDLTVENNAIVSASTFGEGDSGLVEIIATNDVTVDGSTSFIVSQVGSAAVGNSGGIFITTDNLSVLNDAVVGAGTFGQGDSGQVEIMATSDVVVDGADSFIGNQVGLGATGSSGGVFIVTDNLSVLNDAVVSANTFGEGNSGQVEVEATGNVIVDGTDSSINSQVLSGALGSSGGVFITTDNLSVLNDAAVSASTGGIGDSGQVKIVASGNVVVDGTDSSIVSEVVPGARGSSGGVFITTDNLSVLNDAAVAASTFGEGDSGQVEIMATSDIIVDGTDSFIGSEVVSGAVSNSSNVFITADNLSVLNGAIISASTFGKGDSGQIEIVATSDVTVDGINSFIASQVFTGAVGNSGGISIITDNLSVLNGASFSASTFGEGDSGQIEIVATSDVTVDGIESSVDSQVGPRIIGNSGGISITTDKLSIVNDGSVSASTFGEGDSGQIEIMATSDVTVDGTDSFIDSQVGREAMGSSGGVAVTTDNLAVLNGAAVSASTFGEGDSGQVEIEATTNAIVDGGGSFIASRVLLGAMGNSNGISITTDNLAVLNGAAVSASTSGRGNSGQVDIIADNVIVDGSDSSIVSQVGSTAVGDSGGIFIATDNLAVVNGAEVSASTFGGGNSGQVEVTATDNVIVDGSGSFISSLVGSRAVGDSGGTLIMTENLFVLGGAFVTTLTGGRGTAGILRIRSNSSDGLNVVLSEGSSINALTLSQENGGDLIIISDGSLTIQGPGELTTESLGTNTGAAGNLNIFADSVLLDDGVELSTQTASAEGGGNINFFVDGGIILRRGSFINAESTSKTPGSGSGGNITLNAGAVVVIPAENSDIIANAMGGDGGNIRINAAGIFGFTEQSDFRTTDELRANGSSDISASSQSGQQGTINLNADFEQTQALDELPDNFINADQLVSSSCIARSDDAEGAFVVAGNGGLPQQPDSTTSSGYSTGTIQTVPEATASQSFQEPEGVYQLTDGRLVMSQQCQE